MTENTANQTTTDNAREWLRYLDREVRKAERNVQVKTERANGYVARTEGAGVAALREDDLDNYARALQDLRAARAALRTIQETREAAGGYLNAV